MGAHWFRPDECARGGMPGRIVGPVKNRSKQNC
jgi:hypothetical protein